MDALAALRLADVVFVRKHAMHRCTHPVHGHISRNPLSPCSRLAIHAHSCKPSPMPQHTMHLLSRSTGDSAYADQFCLLCSYLHWFQLPMTRGAGNALLIIVVMQSQMTSPPRCSKYWHAAWRRIRMPSPSGSSTYTATPSGLTLAWPPRLVSHGFSPSELYMVVYFGALERPSRHA